MTQITVKRYSIPFKKQLVKEYESGVSLTKLHQKYGIGSQSTVKRWVEQYGREGLRHNLMVIQHPDEQKRTAELEAKISELNELVSQLTLDNFMYKRIIEVAEDELGYKLLEAQKKTNIKSSKKPSKPKSRRGARSK